MSVPFCVCNVMLYCHEICFIIIVSQYLPGVPQSICAVGQGPYKSSVCRPWYDQVNNNNNNSGLCTLCGDFAPDLL